MLPVSFYRDILRGHSAKGMRLGFNSELLIFDISYRRSL